MKRLLTIMIAAVLICAQNACAAPVCIKDSDIGKQLDLPIYEWVDTSKRRAGVIVAVHGLTLYAFAWDKLATRLAQKGYRVFALDQRGFGRWRTEGTKYNGNDKIEIGQSQQDLLDLLTTLRQANPDQKLFCLGESLGANMCLSLASEHPELCDGAILSAPCHKRRHHPKLRTALDVAEEIVEPNKPLNLAPFSEPYLTNDPALAQACNNDPGIYRKMTPVELVKVDLLCNRAFAQAKTLPADYSLLIIAGTADAMFKQSELPKAVKEFGTHNATVTLLPGKGHLLLEHQAVNPSIFAPLDSWLNVRSSASAVAVSPKTTDKTGVE